MACYRCGSPEGVAADGLCRNCYYKDFEEQDWEPDYEPLDDFEDVSRGDSIDIEKRS